MNKILITGASSDIAQELIDKILSSHINSSFILTYNTTNLLKSNIKNTESFKVDWTNKSEVDKFTCYISEQNITHFVQLQGGLTDGGNIEDLDDNLFFDTFNLNIFSSIKIIKAILPNMIKNNYGRIVLMSTASANYGGGFNGFSYGLSKHSVMYLTKYLAKYYARYNIITNSVSPGFINTKLHKQSNRDEDFMTKRAKSIRIGRVGCAKDVSDVIFGLLLENQFVVGENIKIDGADFI